MNVPNAIIPSLVGPLADDTRPRQPFSWKAGALFVITGVGLIIYFRMEKARIERKRVAEATKGIGKPKVGGPFDLVDQDGRRFTHDDLKGKYALVSFHSH